ncbi:MAG TPA: hypothetical protein VFS20_08685 [Longimicrobium sp.]|nr:hypothetical protein [Longimicrobium sp.]
MNGVYFEPPAPGPASAPNRADVALFAGFVHRRPGKLPTDVRDWLVERGWAPTLLPRRPGGTPEPAPPYARPHLHIERLYQLPIPVESWEAFARMFAWERRSLDVHGTKGMGYLAAAVRSFFAQGGRKCYVVRCGRPWRLSSDRAVRMARMDDLVPGYADGVPLSPSAPETWRGIAHVYGLPDVSYLCMPDLADLARPDPRAPEPFSPPLPPREGWVECGPDPEPPGPDQAGRTFKAPRADEAGFEAWARAVRLAARMVAETSREVQVIAGIPLPRPEVVAGVSGRRVAAQDDLLQFLLAARYTDAGLQEPGFGIASAFVQLAYPWVRTAGAAMLPEGLEPPEGVLAGILARNALMRGSYRSAAGLEVGDVWDVHPGLSRDQLHRRQPYGQDPAETRSLLERVSVIGPTQAGLRLLSDVTSAEDESYRPASVNRLLNALIRAARRQGEDSVFEPNGERLWARLQGRLEDLMLDLLRDGALRGSNPSDAFQVRCDRTTMSQNDLDNGRVVATLIFQPSAPVERISVVLAGQAGGELNLVAGREAV